MENDVKKYGVEEMFFSKEAADYLGISAQRLNQLVHAGEITPVKKSNAGSLFLKADLDERKQRVVNIASDIPKSSQAISIDFDTPFMREVINYYTIQSLCGYSDKKAEPVYNMLSMKLDMKVGMLSYLDDLSMSLNLGAEQIEKTYVHVRKSFEKLSNTDYIIKRGMAEYPKKLEVTDEAPPYLFMRGNISLLNENVVSVVGSRTASKDGVERAWRLSYKLGKAGIVVASGLARGIDTAAHSAALENGFWTIAVIGTPITKVYPKENEELQKRIEEFGLVVSQFPPSSPVERWHFPMRNAIMSGISLATAIVEASETSGALKQADYALKQNRFVFIPQSALENDNITWPKRYLQREGAASFSKIDELLSMLEKVKIIPNNNSQMSFFQNSKDASYVRRFE